MLLPVAHLTRPLLFVSSIELNTAEGLVAQTVHASGGARIGLKAAG